MNYLLPPDQPKTKTCPDCFGAGSFKNIFDWEGEPEMCHTCNGEGEILIDSEPPENEKDDE